MVDRLFGNGRLDLFVSFSATHLITIAIAVLGVVLMYLFRKQLQEERANKIVRYSLIVGLLIGKIIWPSWRAAHGLLSPTEDLPLHLCNISGYLSLYVLFTRKKGIYDFLFYAGLLGASVAILTPDVRYNFPHITYWGYMIDHYSIVMTCWFLLVVEGWRPSNKSVQRTFLLLNALLVVTVFVNKWTGGNYMYVSHKPANPTLLDVMGPYPWYLLSLEGVVLVVCSLIYLPFWLQDRKATRTKQEKIA